MAKSADGQYALKRLTRGVCSSRDFARPGFSSALAALIAVLLEGSDRETLQKKRNAILSLVLECTTVPGIHDRKGAALLPFLPTSFPLHLPGSLGKVFTAFVVFTAHPQGTD